MSYRVARVGDPLDHGGQVQTGSPSLTAEGRKIARVGDTALCAQHGEVTITTGSASNADEGKKWARVTSQCSCGAIITDGSPSLTCD